MSTINIPDRIRRLKVRIENLKHMLRYNYCSEDDRADFELCVEALETELTALTAQHAILTNCDHADSLLA